MSLFSSDRPDLSGFASIILRQDDNVLGLREISDRSQNLRILTFPFARTEAVCAERPMRFAGTYILAGDGIAYIGETSDLSIRLQNHAQDATRRFATEVFVVSAFNNNIFDKDAAQHLELRFVNDAQAAGLVRLQNEKSPPLTRRPPERVFALNRMASDAYRLLFDAGCRVFASPNDKAVMARRTFELPNASFEDLEMTIIERARIPEDAQEFELEYTQVWARGYQSDRMFVVLAGSEMRAELNASTHKICLPRREKLIESGAVVKLATSSDVYRFTISVGFKSPSVAAKIVCGAHISAEHWKQVTRTVSPNITAAIPVCMEALQ